MVRSQSFSEAGSLDCEAHLYFWISHSARRWDRAAAVVRGVGGSTALRGRLQPEAQVGCVLLWFRLCLSSWSWRWTLWRETQTDAFQNGLFSLPLQEPWDSFSLIFTAGSWESWPKLLCCDWFPWRLRGSPLPSWPLQLFHMSQHLTGSSFLLSCDCVHLQFWRQELVP